MRAGPLEGAPAGARRRAARTVALLSAMLASAATSWDVPGDMAQGEPVVLSADGPVAVRPLRILHEPGAWARTGPIPDGELTITLELSRPAGEVGGSEDGAGSRLRVQLVPNQPGTPVEAVLDPAAPDALLEVKAAALTSCAADSFCDEGWSVRMEIEGASEPLRVSWRAALRIPSLASGSRVRLSFE